MQAGTHPETDEKDLYFNWILTERHSGDRSNEQIFLQVYNFKFLFLGLSGDANSPNTVQPFKIANKSVWLSDV